MERRYHGQELNHQPLHLVRVPLHYHLVVWGHLRPKITFITGICKFSEYNFWKNLGLPYLKHRVHLVVDSMDIDFLWGRTEGKSHSTPIGVFSSTNVFSKQVLKEITLFQEFEGQPPLGSSSFLKSFLPYYLPLASYYFIFSSKLSPFPFAKAICVAKWRGSKDLEHTTCYLLWAPHCSLEAFEDVVLVMGALMIRPVKVFPKRCVHNVFLIMVPYYCFVLGGGPQNLIEDKVILGNPYHPSRSSSNKAPKWCCPRNSCLLQTHVEAWCWRYGWIWLWIFCGHVV